jgi:Flp pilus assembly protein TadG
MPILVLLLFGLLGVGRLTTTLIGLSAVAREAARAGSVQSTAAEASFEARSRGQQVGNEYRLTNGSLAIAADVSRWGPRGEVSVTVSYTTHLADVPLIGLADLSLQRTAWEIVGPWRTLGSDA